MSEYNTKQREVLLRFFNDNVHRHFTAAEIELSETYFEVKSKIANTVKPITIAKGQQTAKMPTLVATPLPPLNSKKKGNT